MAAVTLEGIDQVRERTGVSYHACYEALEAEGGDVVAAVLRLERRRPAWMARASGACNDLMGAVRRVADQAAGARITVHRDDRTVAEVPVLLAAVGAALVPGLAAAGLLAAIATGAWVTVGSRPETAAGFEGAASTAAGA